ncbi:class I SAM-dependent methyltransferase [Streptosporangium fragile]
MGHQRQSTGYDDGGCDARYTRTACLWGRRPDRIADALGDALSLPPAPDPPGTPDGSGPPAPPGGAGMSTAPPPVASAGPAVLDVGCGEGRNAVRLARRGARVLAMDVSAAALENGAKAWGGSLGALGSLGAGGAGGTPGNGGGDGGGAPGSGGTSAFPRSGGIEWRRGDARTARLAPASFDGVLACSVLHWLADEAQVADVIARLQAATGPGGVHALLMFNSGHAYRPPAGEMRMPVLLPHDWYLARYAGWTVLSASDTDSTHTHRGHEEPHTHAVTRLVARKEAHA